VLFSTPIFLFAFLPLLLLSYFAYETTFDPDCQAREELENPFGICTGYLGWCRPGRTTCALGVPLSVLVVHDSFFRALQPYCSETFHEVTDYKSSGFNTKQMDFYINRVHPDLVIEEIVERDLVHAP